MWNVNWELAMPNFELRSRGNEHEFFFLNISPQTRRWGEQSISGLIAGHYGHHSHAVQKFKRTRGIHIQHGRHKRARKRNFTSVITFQPTFRPHWKYSKFFLFLAFERAARTSQSNHQYGCHSSIPNARRYKQSTRANGDFDALESQAISHLSD